MTAEATTRQPRGFTTREVILAFARYGVPIDTIARALVTQSDQVKAVCHRAFTAGDLSRMPPQSPEDMRGAMATELVHLREQVSDLQSLTRELQGASSDAVFDLCGLGLTPSEARIVAALMEGGRVTKSRLFNALYGALANPDDAPEPKIIDVLVCKIRKKFKAHAVEIGTIWGWGYEIVPDHVAKLRAIVAERNAPSLVPTDKELGLV